MSTSARCKQHRHATQLVSLNRTTMTWNTVFHLVSVLRNSSAISSQFQIWVRFSQSPGSATSYRFDPAPFHILPYRRHDKSWQELSVISIHWTNVQEDSVTTYHVILVQITKGFGYGMTESRMCYTRSGEVGGESRTSEHRTLYVASMLQWTWSVHANKAWGLRFCTAEITTPRSNLR